MLVIYGCKNATLPYNCSRLQMVPPQAPGLGMLNLFERNEYVVTEMRLIINAKDIPVLRILCFVTESENKTIYKIK